MTPGTVGVGQAQLGAQAQKDGLGIVSGPGTLCSPGTVGGARARWSSRATIGV